MKFPKMTMAKLAKRYRMVLLFRSFNAMLNQQTRKFPDMALAEQIARGITLFKKTEPVSDWMEGHYQDWHGAFRLPGYYALVRQQAGGKRIELCVGHASDGLIAFLHFDGQQRLATWVYYADEGGYCHSNLLPLVATYYHRCECRELSVMAENPALVYLPGILAPNTAEQFNSLGVNATVAEVDQTLE